MGFDNDSVLNKIRNTVYYTNSAISPSKNHTSVDNDCNKTNVCALVRKYGTNNTAQNIKQKNVIMFTKLSKKVTFVNCKF